MGNMALAAGAAGCALKVMALVCKVVSPAVPDAAKAICCPARFRVPTPGVPLYVITALAKSPPRSTKYSGAVNSDVFPSQSAPLAWNWKVFGPVVGKNA